MIDIRKIDSTITELDYITEVAKDCIANLEEKDKRYLIENPYAEDYHFSYGLYIRNNYVYNADFSMASFYVDPDDVSGDVLEMIFSMIVPDYKYDDTFIKEIFFDKKYRDLRKKFFERYGYYPVELIEKYRENYNIVIDSMMDVYINEPDDDKADEYVKEVIREEHRLMAPFIEELKEMLNV